ncbi:MAG: DUF896 domain-containing protein [Lachnospiraceae bacterium]|nr:DUF896 domain-containing protein [Lachnospiraceae bacterium]
MNIEELTKRINELYHKSQAEGLTEEEKAEQAELRKQYVQSFKNNLQNQLEHMSIQRPDGTIEKVRKIK